MRVSGGGAAFLYVLAAPIPAVGTGGSAVELGGEEGISRASLGRSDEASTFFSSLSFAESLSVFAGRDKSIPTRTGSGSSRVGGDSERGGYPEP